MTRAIQGLVFVMAAHQDPFSCPISLFVPASSALKGLSQDQMRRLYYRTATSTSFKGQAQPKDARGENFYDLYQIGQRDSKYMKYPYKHAPNFNRTSCEYSREFHQLPLNKDITDEISKFVKTKQGFGRPKVQAHFDGSTKYNEDFNTGLSAEERRNAHRESYKPTVSVVGGRPPHPLRGTDKLEETHSHEHEQFFARPLELAKATKAAKPKSNIGLQAMMVPYITGYDLEFNSGKEVPFKQRRRKRCQSAPTYLAGRRDEGEKLAPDAEPAAEGSTAQANPPPRQRARPQSAGAIQKSVSTGQLEQALPRQRARPQSAIQKSSSLGHLEDDARPCPANTGARGRPVSAPSQKRAA